MLSALGQSMFEEEEYDGDLMETGHSYSQVTKPFALTTQTGKNVGKVRWLQDRTNQLIPDPLSTEYFVSSTTGESASGISLWSLAVERGQGRYEGEMNAKAEKIDGIECPSTVMDLVPVSDELFALATAAGEFRLYSCPRREEDGAYNRVEHVLTKELHKLRNGTIPCPARGVAVAANGTSAVTVGEDGSIFEVSLIGDNNVDRSYEKVDLSIYCVDFVGRHNIVTGNAGGQLKLWDLRKGKGDPVQVMNPNVVINNVYGAISLAVHPSQSHLVIVGYQSGCMDLYDLRMGEPLANLASEGGSISEVYFHSIYPDQFFTCSQSGQVCQWYPGSGDFDMQDMSSYTPDVNVEFLKRGLVYKQLYSSYFPINSLNLSKNDKLIAGSDSGVIFSTEVRPHH